MKSTTERERERVGCFTTTQFRRSMMNGDFSSTLMLANLYYDLDLDRTNDEGKMTVNVKDFQMYADSIKYDVKNSGGRITMLGEFLYESVNRFSVILNSWEVIKTSTLHGSRTEDKSVSICASKVSKELLKFGTKGYVFHQDTTYYCEKRKNICRMCVFLAIL